MKKTVRENYRVEVTSDIRGRALPKDEKAYHATMINLLADLVRQINKHVEDTDGVNAVWDTRYVCSHCGLAWAPMTAAQAAWSDRRYHLDEHSIEGEPGCCDKAIAEFRTERGIPLP
jgi:hypothetical protein